MNVVIDANIVIAVVLGEPERAWAIQATRAATAIAPRSLPFEIGNTLSGLLKRRRLSKSGVQAAWSAATAFQVTLCDIDMRAALRLAAAHDIYAYDTYMLQCAVETASKLATLDKKLAHVARTIGLDVLEP